ncbi:hypothetical protein SAMN04488109_2847 [Chryseolinea serpens]|uniref:Uncharacterized protein n=1 Tax=Chryseolinea serpens TaxID=947013 RepID=A0A1M5QJK7_9BACT|nr:hypothetical protein SAMN04488109_2847 [Chryseolinea serpens]
MRTALVLQWCFLSEHFMRGKFGEGHQIGDDEKLVDEFHMWRQNLLVKNTNKGDGVNLVRAPNWG